MNIFSFALLMREPLVKSAPKKDNIIFGRDNNNLRQRLYYLQPMQIHKSRSECAHFGISYDKKVSLSF